MTHDKREGPGWWEDPETGEIESLELPLPWLKEMVAKAGLRLIGPAEVAVLDASAKVSQRWLEQYVRILVPEQADADAYRWCEAELARRKAKP